MDGPRSMTDPGASRPDLPIWERTPRAVPPQLGAPPPVGGEGKPKLLTAIGRAPANQGSMAPVTAGPRTPWGARPVAAPADTRSVVPTGPPPTSRQPLTRRRLVAVGAGAVVVVVAVAATAVAMRAGTSAGAQASTRSPDKPPVSRPSQIPAATTSPSTPSMPSAPGAPSTPSATTIQPTQGGDQSPVSLALANLSAQPMLHYSGLSPDGHSSWQLTVTSSGEAQGVIDLGGGELSVLEVGGRTYFKAADTASVRLLGTLPSGMPAASVRGKWVTGDSGLDGLLPSGLASAGNLAASLQSALTSQDTGSPPSTDAATPVTTSAGVLYITTTQPYRMLRLVPPTAQLGQPTEIDAVSQTSVSTFFAGLIDQTKTLTDALDFGVVFHYGEDPKLYCSDSTCTVAVNSVVASAADQNAAPTDAVVADVTAKVTVGRQPAGQCEVNAKLPLDRPKNLSCQDPDAAAVVQSLGGGDLTVSVGLQFEALAETPADVDALVAAEANEQSAASGTQSPAPGDYLG
jgi:hypothetical protein